MSTELLHEQSGMFSGKYPDIPTRSNFQIDENDNAPFFVTLPIGKVDSLSGNGRLYDRDFYTELVRQVNHAPQENPIRGIVGHSDPNGASWKVDLPAIEWVGATLLEDGMAWGKAYVYPEEDRLRGTIRRAMKANGKVATSIWGEAKMDGNRATSPTIKRIDYADPERAGVKAAIGIPQITSEMNGEKTMSDNQELITELRSDRDAARAQLTELQGQLSDLRAKYDAIAPKFASLQEMSNEKDVVVFVSELLQAHKASEAEKLKLEVDKLISEQIKLEIARPLIATMLVGVQSKADAQRRLAELLNLDTVKTTLQTLALAVSGGRAYIAEQEDDSKFSDSPEATAKAKAYYGIG